MQIRLRDLDVIPKHIVESDFQRLNACSSALAQFDLSDVLAAIAADVAQLIKPGVIARAYGPSVGEIHRRFFRDGVQNTIANVRYFVQPAGNRPHACSVEHRSLFLQFRNERERAA